MHLPHIEVCVITATVNPITTRLDGCIIVAILWVALYWRDTQQSTTMTSVLTRQRLSQFLRNAGVTVLSAAKLGVVPLLRITPVVMIPGWPL